MATARRNDRKTCHETSNCINIGKSFCWRVNLPDEDVDENPEHTV